MTTYALTGNDDLFINDTPMTDLADGSTVTITYSNEKVGTSTGKNGNTIYATNEQGRNAQVELRVVVGSKTDLYLNGLSIKQDRDLPTFQLMNGSFTKRVGNGSGRLRRINYVLLGGVFKQNIDTQENLQGETEQGVALYRMFFAAAQRAII